MIKTLPIVSYLNQKSVFDLLAIINDGFTQVTSFSMTSQENGKNSLSGEASFGIKNVFGLLNISSKASGSKEQSKSESGTTNGERVHTPTSLFIKLLTSLEDEKLVNDLKNESDLTKLKSGEFVKLKGRLEINPLVSVLESFIQIGEVATLFNTNGKKKNDEDVIRQMKKIKGSLTQNNMVDLICNLTSTEIKAVIPVSLDYFFKENMNDIVDGDYTVFGKVVKVVKQEGDHINLYRNTGFKHFKEEKLDQMLSFFNLGSNGEFNLPEINSKINTPSLLVIPIAIYS